MHGDYQGIATQHHRYGSGSASQTVFLESDCRLSDLLSHRMGLRHWNRSTSLIIALPENETSRHGQSPSLGDCPCRLTHQRALGCAEMPFA